MRLAREQIDVALFTAEPRLVDWWVAELGLEPAGTMPLTDGRVQHRFAYRGGLVKLNLGPVPEAGPSALRGLVVRGDGGDVEDPEGNALWRVADAACEIGLRFAAREPAASLDWLERLGGRERDADGVTLGAARVIMEADGEAPETPALVGPGWRYPTVQVWGCDSAWDAALAAGGEAMMAPQTYGEVARFCMVRAPGGSVWEFSQNARLVGTLAPR